MVINSVETVVRPVSKPAKNIIAKRVDDYIEFTRLILSDDCEMIPTTFGAYGLEGEWVKYYWIDPQKLSVKR